MLRSFAAAAVFTGRASADEAATPAEEVADAGPPKTLLLPGTRWETPMYVLAGKVEGPTVMVFSGVHGGEIAGPLAADALLDQPPHAGTLVVIPRCNLPALDTGKRLTPRSAHPDLNRNFPREPEEEPRGMMAREIWRRIAEVNPDIVLDLHEGLDFHNVNRRSVGNTVLVVPTATARWLSLRALHVANSMIEDTSHRFLGLGGPARGSIVRSSHDVFGIDAMILETTRKAPLELRIQQHLAMVREILQALDEVDGQTPVEPEQPSEPPAEPPVEPQPPSAPSDPDPPSSPPSPPEPPSVPPEPERPSAPAAPERPQTPPSPEPARPDAGEAPKPSIG